MGGYVRVQWADVCREISKLRLVLRKGAKVIALPVAKTGTLGDISGDNRASIVREALFYNRNRMGVTGVEPVTSTV